MQLQRNQKADKLFYFISCLAFCFLLTYISIDTYKTQNDIDANNNVISTLSQSRKNNEKKIHELKIKIDQLHKDPKSAETILMKKFKMLRKDQFIIDDTTD